MVLPENIDSTYANSGSDPSVELHQQHHDEIHAAINTLASNTAKVTRQSSTFSVPNNAFTPITWDTEVWDLGGLVDLGTQATRVTVAVDGKYHINAGCIIVANATGVRVLAVKKNGTTYLAEQMLPASSAIDQGMSIDVDDTATAGDYYQIEVYQNSGAARNLSASVYNRCSIRRFAA